jgi:uncharacterized membrane protein
MKPDWKREAPALVILALMFAVAAVMWTRVPDRLPVHWGLTGEANRWGGRFEGLLGLPLVTTGLYALFLVLPFLDPRRAHYPAFARPYRAIRTVLVATLFALELFKVVWVDAGMGAAPGTLALVFGAMTVVIGNYLPKVQSNWFVGVRTPWTLTSEESWRRTHRLAGWLFVAIGLVSIAAALVVPRQALLVFLVLQGIGALTSIVYSYLVWRRDPSRTPPADLQ